MQILIIYARGVILNEMSRLLGSDDHKSFVSSSVAKQQSFNNPSIFENYSMYNGVL